MQAHGPSAQVPVDDQGVRCGVHHGSHQGARGEQSPQCTCNRDVSNSLQPFDSVFVGPALMLQQSVVACGLLRMRYKPKTTLRNFLTLVEDHDLWKR